MLIFIAISKALRVRSDRQEKFQRLCLEKNWEQ